MSFILKILRIYRVTKTEKHLTRLLSKALRSAERFEKQTAIMGIEDIGDLKEAAPVINMLLSRAYRLLKLSGHPLICLPEMQEAINKLANSEKIEDNKKD